MSSTITNFSTLIDVAYPQAGVSNNTQGLRNNFTYIQNGLSVAAQEITSIQVNAVDRTKAVNDLNFQTVLTGVQLKNSGEIANLSPSTATNLSGFVEVDFRNGSYQSFTFNNTTATTFIVKNWPTVSSVYSQVRLAVRTTGAINFNPGTGFLFNTSAIPYSSTSTAATTVWDIWTADTGNNVFVNFVGGPFN
jgi:hypothetical protein